MIIQSMNTLTLCNGLNKNRAKANENIEKVSSGKRINRASDDAAGLSISESFKSQVRGLSKAQENTQNGISMMQTVDGVLENISEQIRRMKEISVQSANGTLTDEDRKLADQEFQNIKSSIDDSVDKCEFNTIKLLKEDKTLTIQVGENPYKTYDIKLSKMDTNSIGIGDASIDTRSNAENAIKKVDDSLQKIVDYRVDVGSHLNNLQHAFNECGNGEVNITASLSKIEDIDMATAFMSMIKNNVITNYSQSMLIGANQNNKAVMELVK